MDASERTDGAKRCGVSLLCCRLGRISVVCEYPGDRKDTTIPSIIEYMTHIACKYTTFAVVLNI